MKRKVSGERSTVLPQHCGVSGHPRELGTGTAAVPGTARRDPPGKISLLLKQGKSVLPAPTARLPPLPKLVT